MATFSSRTAYNRLHEALGGLDLSGEGATDARRLHASENLWRDYEGEGDGALESVVGFRRLFDFISPIRALHRQITRDGDFIVVQAGAYLYRFPYDGRDARSCEYIGRVTDSESRSFRFGERLFLLDGQFLSCLERSGFFAHVAEGNVDPYVPTTFRDGVPLEQRNLLTDRFRESYTLTLPEAMTYGTPGLCYEEDPSAEDAVRVTGIGTAAGAVYIPARIRFRGRTCRVSGIKARAFSSAHALTELFVGEGVTYIDRFAFYGCDALRTVVLPSSLTDIGTQAFGSCGTLATLYLGAGLERIGADAFAAVGQMKEAYYASDAASFLLIEGHEALNAVSMRYDTSYGRYRVAIPVHSPASSVTSLTIYGLPFSFGTTVREGRVQEIFVDVDDSYNLLGAQAELSGTLVRASDSDGSAPSFLEAYAHFTEPLARAIHGCTLACVFDGRVFLSGHPALPGLVFYSAYTKDGVSDPTYFGVYNYFSDSLSHMPVVALLAIGDTLAVFKKDDDGEGSIRYHTPTDTDDPLLPRIYPVTAVHRGLGTIGAVGTFLDEAVFLGTEGLCALTGHSLTGERSVTVRSRPVAARLLTERLTEARLGRLGGYLCISIDGRIYLADPRRTFRHESGEVQYEWYLLSGVGSHKDDTRLYRYATESYAQLALSAHPDEPVEGELFTGTFDSGSTYTYAKEDGVPVAVYATEERVGGVFHPATALLDIDGHLFFGTDMGSLCCFNTDRRGVPPSRLSGSSDFDPEAYRASYGRRFHPDEYAFDSHAPRYALALCADDVGLSHMRKSTVPHSLAVRLRTDGAPALHLEVSTDRRGRHTLGVLRCTPPCFEAIDFAAFSFEVQDTFTLPLPERERDWTHKQIALYSDSFRAPIAVYSIGYRFTVDGRIKKF